MTIENGAPAIAGGNGEHAPSGQDDDQVDAGGGIDLGDGDGSSNFDMSPIGSDSEDQTDKAIDRGDASPPTDQGDADQGDAGPGNLRTALDSERQRSRELQREKRALQEQAERSQATLQALINRVNGMDLGQGQSQQNGGQGQPQGPSVDELLAMEFVAVPNEYDDPEGHKAAIEQNNKIANAQRQAILGMQRERAQAEQQTRQQQERQRQVNALHQHIARDIEDYAVENPNFAETEQALSTYRMQQLMAVGLPYETAYKEVEGELLRLANHARQTKQNYAKMITAMVGVQLGGAAPNPAPTPASQGGTTPAPQPSAQQNQQPRNDNGQFIAQKAQDAQRNKSLGGANGQGTKGKPTLETFGQMTPDEVYEMDDHVLLEMMRSAG